MGSFKLGKMTFRSLFGRPATAMYPVVKREPFERTKGHVTNDIEACILCGICEKKCPTQAIVVDRAARTWSIDPYRCIQCRSCVLACPKKSLAMDTTYPAPSTSKASITITKPESAA